MRNELWLDRSCADPAHSILMERVAAGERNNNVSIKSLSLALKSAVSHSLSGEERAILLPRAASSSVNTRSGLWGADRRSRFVYSGIKALWILFDSDAFGFSGNKPHLCIHRRFPLKMLMLRGKYLSSYSSDKTCLGCPLLEEHCKNKTFSKTRVFVDRNEPKPVSDPENFVHES